MGHLSYKGTASQEFTFSAAPFLYLLTLIQFSSLYQFVLFYSELLATTHFHTFPLTNLFVLISSSNLGIAKNVKNAGLIAGS